MPLDRTPTETLDVSASGPLTAEVSPGSPTTGKRRAPVPADFVPLAQAGTTSYVGRRRAAVVAEAEPTPVFVPAPRTSPEDRSYVGRRRLEPDTAAIERVLAALEPVDQTTSFESEATVTIPLPAFERSQPVPGRRRADVRETKHRRLPSPLLTAGVAVLAVSMGGAVLTRQDTRLASAPTSEAISAVGVTATSGQATVRGGSVSRDSRRDALSAYADSPLVDAAESQERERNQALANLAQQAQTYSDHLEKNAWVLPVAGYHLTARFGDYSGLWSTFHTGLDFAAPSGTPIVAVANGVVTSAGYDGSYGNKTVITLEDGTELWFCHQTSYAVSVGETVHAGEVIGYVGSTGNVTGPHLHLEVRPGGGDPVDPYAALVAHGVTP